MSKSELNEKDLQGINGGANMIFVKPEKKTFWKKLLGFFMGKDKSDPNTTTVADISKVNTNIDLNKNPMAARETMFEANNKKA